MPLEPAIHSTPAVRRRAARLCLAGCFAAIGLAACTSPTPVTIAEFQDAAAPDSGVGAAGASGEAGANGAGSTPFVISPTRGRVKVENGRLVSDVNTPLRGLLLPVDTGWALSSYDLDVITSYAQKMGLNTLHVYLEDAGQVTGSMENTADALVAQAGRVGMYVILGVGTGVNVGSFDSSKLNEFWPLYAARYADQPHVLFEIQNNPENTCDSPVAAKTFAMEHALYKVIRAAAPESHILLLSTTNLIKPSVLEDAITNLGTDVDWSNASIDMDITSLQTPCQPLASLAELTDVAQAHGVALLIGQLPRTAWGPYVAAFEQAQLGWMQYTFFADPALRSVASYVSAVTAAGVTWCPDQGIFPLDSRTCAH